MGNPVAGRDRRVAPAWTGDSGMASRSAARCCDRAAGSVAPTVDSPPMNRWWAVIPLAVAVAMPICATPSFPIVAIEAVAVLLCVLGIAGARTGPVTAGCIVATIGYAVALLSGSADLDLTGGGIFGLALLSARFERIRTPFSRCGNRQRCSTGPARVLASTSGDHLGHCRRADTGRLYGVVAGPARRTCDRFRAGRASRF